MGLMIETHSLSHRYGVRMALDGVDLQVPERAIYGFLGRNGAGKTTTIRAVLGLLRPTAGTIRVAGFDVSNQRQQAARCMGALLDGHGFYPNLTGRENLWLTCQALDLPAREIDRVLEIVELSTAARERVGRYSLGMRQRLGLGRALLGQPKVLILDEPTNGLDPEGIEDIRRLLTTLPDQSGCTILLCSHNLSEVEQLATHVGIIAKGRLVVQGAMEALKADQPQTVRLRTPQVDPAAALVARCGTVAKRGPDELHIALPARTDAGQVVAELIPQLSQAAIPVHAIHPIEAGLSQLYDHARSLTQSTQC